MFEDLKNFREVGDFDLLSPTMNSNGIFDSALLRNALSDRQKAGCRHIGLELNGIQGLSQEVMEVLWYFLQEPNHQKPGSLAILGPADLKTVFAPFFDLKGFLFFAHETEMIAWSLHHHEESADMEVATPPRTIVTEAVTTQAVQSPKSSPVTSSPKSPTPAPKWLLPAMVAVAILLVVVLVLGVLH